MTKPVFGVSDKARLKPVSSDTQTNEKNEIQLLKIKILFNKQITKALTRLRGCAGWSASLLFTNTNDRFSRVEAHITICHLQILFVIGMCLKGLALEGMECICLLEQAEEPYQQIKLIKSLKDRIRCQTLNQNCIMHQAKMRQ